MTVNSKKELYRSPKWMGSRTLCSPNPTLKVRSARTQTRTRQRNASVNVKPDDVVATKAESTNAEMDPVPGRSVAEDTQITEHMTRGELRCVEWVNDHMFWVNLCPTTFYADDALKEDSMDCYIGSIYCEGGYPQLVRKPKLYERLEK